MPSPTLATSAWVLGRRLPTEKFQAFTLFSADHGILTSLHRIPRKSASTSVSPDLFDELAVILESSNQGQTWFLKESRLLVRHAEIGHSYNSLKFASAFALLVSKNDVHEESRAKVYTLLRTAFAAFATSAPPEIVYFKSIYCFARDEGYPVKQEWLPTLPRDLTERVRLILRTPLAAFPASRTVDPEAILLLRNLEEYLRGHTDLLVEPQ